MSLRSWIVRKHFEFELQTPLSVFDPDEKCIVCIQYCIYNYSIIASMSYIARAYMTTVWAVYYTVQCGHVALMYYYIATSTVFRVLRFG